MCLRISSAHNKFGSDYRRLPHATKKRNFDGFDRRTDVDCLRNRGECGKDEVSRIERDIIQYQGFRSQAIGLRENEEERKHHGHAYLSESSNKIGNRTLKLVLL
jgi:hypothetical protein